MHDIMAKPWGAVEQLLLAADSSPQHLTRTVQKIGLEITVDAIVDELIVRFDSPLPELTCRFQLEITCGAECAGRVLTIDGDAVDVEPGWSDAVMARIRFVAADLVESLFGPTERRSPTQRDVTWHETPIGRAEPKKDAALSQVFRHWQQMTSALHAVLRACETHPADLGGLSARFGSDKWANFHWYTQHYDRHFANLRTKPIRLLEIGIGGYQHEDMGGASLRMWQRYFSRGLVYGLDIFPKPGVHGPRIQAVQGSQNDPEFLDELGRQLGPFDIVIDDGSHINDHVKTSFSSLFPHVQPGGLYVIEDLQTAYWPGYGGDDHDLINANTSIYMLKALVDGLNHQEIPENNRKTPSYTDRHVVGLHFYHNLAVIEKGLNAEDGLSSFIPRNYSGGPCIWRDSRDLFQGSNSTVATCGERAMTRENNLYLELLKKVLTNVIYQDAPHGGWGNPKGYDPAARAEGRDWPTVAHTMVGLQRLDNIQMCMTRVLDEHIPGDFIETGVWRGGACIFMRAILEVYGCTDRIVWVADSFQGVPETTNRSHPTDEELALYRANNVLAVPIQAVQENFRRYGLLDGQVKFLPGWFKDSLPEAPIDRLAVLRLDGDLYESTMNALENLYPKLSTGGFVIVDDHTLPGCRDAVRDFRNKYGIEDTIQTIDYTGVYWRRTAYAGQQR